MKRLPFDVADLVAPAGTLAEYTKPVAGAEPLTFQTEGVALPATVTLMPLYRLNHRRDNLYCSIYTPEEFALHQAAEEHGLQAPVHKENNQ